MSTEMTTKALTLCQHLLSNLNITQKDLVRVAENKQSKFINSWTYPS